MLASSDCSPTRKTHWLLHTATQCCYTIIYRPNFLGKPLKKNDQCQWSILNFFGVQPVFSDDALIAGRWWCWWCTVHWCIILVETYLLPLHTNHHHYSTECTNTLVETPNTFWCRRKHCILVHFSVMENFVHPQTASLVSGVHLLPQPESSSFVSIRDARSITTLCHNIYYNMKCF